MVKVVMGVTPGQKNLNAAPIEFKHFTDGGTGWVWGAYHSFGHAFGRLRLWASHAQGINSWLAFMEKAQIHERHVLPFNAVILIKWSGK